jgi:hypothetical protein
VTSAEETDGLGQQLNRGFGSTLPTVLDDYAYRRQVDVVALSRMLLPTAWENVSDVGKGCTLPFISFDVIWC